MLRSIVLIALFAAVPAAAQEELPPGIPKGAVRVDPPPNFDPMKQLQRPEPPELLFMKQFEGTWEGVYGSGDSRITFKLIFKLLASDKYVHVTLFPGWKREQVQVWYSEGPFLKVTHFDLSGRIPTLVSRSFDGNRLEMEYIRGDNLDPMVDQHYHSSVIEKLDDGRLRQTWFMWRDGEEVAKHSYTLTRVQ